MFFSGGDSKNNKLEMDNLYEQIDRRYDEYITSCYKSPFQKTKYEERVQKAKFEKRLNIQFLQAELTFIEQQIRIVHSDIQKNMLKDQANDGRDFADRVLDNLADELEQYKAVPIHETVPLHIERLYGFLKIFYEKRWSSLLVQLSKADYKNRFYYEDLNYELIKLADFTGRTPPVIDAYIHKAETFGFGKKEMEEEHRRLLIRAAHILHKLKTAFYQAAEMPLSVPEFSKEGDNLKVVIKDFKIVDFKPR